MKRLLHAFVFVFFPVSASQSLTPEEGAPKGDICIRLPGCGLPRLPGENDDAYQDRELEFMIRGIQNGYDLDDLMRFLNGLAPTVQIVASLSPLEDGSLDDSDPYGLFPGE